MQRFRRLLSVCYLLLLLAGAQAQVSQQRDFPETLQTRLEEAKNDSTTAYRALTLYNGMLEELETPEFDSLRNWIQLYRTQQYMKLEKYAPAKQIIDSTLFNAQRFQDVSLQLRLARENGFVLLHTYQTAIGRPMIRKAINRYRESDLKEVDIELGLLSVAMMLYDGEQAFDSAAFFGRQGFLKARAIAPETAMPYAAHLARLFAIHDQPDSARHYFGEAHALAEEYPIARDRLGVLYEYEALFYYEEGEREQAQKSCEKALEIALELGWPGIAKDCYSVMAQIAQDEGNWQLAMEYLENSSAIQDSIYSLSNPRQIADMELFYQTREKDAALQLEQERSRFLEEKNDRIRYQNGAYILGIVVLGLILVLAIGWIVNSRSRIRINKELLEAKQNELQFKTREISDFAAYLGHYRDILGKVLEQVKLLKVTGTKNQQTINSIQWLIKTHEQSFGEEILHAKLENYGKAFYANISEKHPGLTKSELQLAALLRADLSTKQIAVFKSISTKSVEVARSRLRSKLGLERKVPLPDYLKSIEGS